MAAVVEAAVLNPAPRLFEYLPPAGMNSDALLPGTRLRVPFGRREAVAIVMGHKPHSTWPADKLRPVTAVLDEAPVLGTNLLALVRWASDYYHHPLGEVVKAALPASLRRPKVVRRQTQFSYRLTEAGRDRDIPAERARRQAHILTCLRQFPDGCPAATLTASFKGVTQVLDALRKKGLVDRFESSITTQLREPARPVELNPEQRAAADKIAAQSERFQVHVLDGVTGSGKTEVYIDLIQRTMALGQQSLVLIPEIGLTPQTAARFERSLGIRCALFHSGLSDGDRAAAWLGAARGEAAVVIGTRSAVFTPFPRLGLVVVDEEHDPSYKQFDGFRYSARDLAIVRARLADIPIVLGSATPGLDTLRGCETKRYQRHRLKRRARGASLPAPRVIDLRHRPLTAGLSPDLINAVAANNEAGNQTLLFLNRRGYAPAVLCRRCGVASRCSRCEANLVLHKTENLLTCHHCGVSKAARADCAECGGPIRTAGVGTEKLHEWLCLRFPKSKVIRFDRDAIRGKSALIEALDAMRTGEAQIVVGTQMLAKGHDLPGVTLVGIVDADSGFFSADLRAAERTAQLIVQVAGRAGRAQRPGEVYIQTYNPQNPQVTCLLGEGYHAFAAHALEERQAAGFPPFARLVLMRAEAHDADTVFAFLHQAQSHMSEAAAARSLSILGPVPAPMARRAGRFRGQLLLHGTTGGPLHEVLRASLPLIRKFKTAGRVRWSVDIDPHELS